MGKLCHLNHAPIVEALIDIQFAPVADMDLSAIAVELSGGRSSSISDLFETMFEFRVEDGASPQSSSIANIAGKRLDFGADHRVIQIRNSGFTFSRLAPYDTWEEMVKPTLVAWRQFQKYIGAGKVNRVALRYINVLELPLPLDSFDRYLTSPPQVPKDLQQGISGFLTRVVCPLKEDLLTITQSLESEASDSSAVKVALDIEVSHERELDRLDVMALERVLDRLRAAKNDAFFAYLTDDALELFK